MSTRAAHPDIETQPPTTVMLTRAINKMDSSLDFVYRILGYVCGTLLLLLGMFITYQVIARKLGGPMAPGMDQLSGYVLAFAGTWAFSYSLRSGSHVRIDVLLPLFSRIHPYMRSTADWLALASVGFFGAITAWKTWEEVFESYCISNDPVTGACVQALTNTYPLTPLWIPQTVVAIGFSMLAFTSFQWMISMVLRGILEIAHKAQGGDVADLAASDIAQEAASGV